jgi:beta-glucanase (GH16 family)
MTRIPRKRLALAVTGAVLPLLVLGPHVGADAASPAPAATVSSVAPTLHRTTVRHTARATIPRTKWAVVYSSSRTAPAPHTVWRARAAFRAAKRHPVIKLQVRQLVGGHVVTSKTKKVRTKHQGWKAVSASVRPVSENSTFQVLVRRNNLRGGSAKMKHMRVSEGSPVVVADPPTTDPTTDPPTDPSSGDLPGWGAPNFDDEFNGNAVDPTKWNVRTKTNLGLTMDGAIPEASQVTVNNGLLHLKADWLPTPEARPVSATGVKVLTHKTGYIDQRALHAGDVSRGQRYGRWEIRCKTPTGTDTLGALAAFWLRNSNKGEIDMMEAWGYGTDFPTAGKIMKDNTKTTFFADTSTTASLITQVRHHEFGGPAVPWDGFHTYAFELLPTRASVIEDGKTIWTTTPAKTPAIWGPSFQSPLHMRLNLHVGPSATYWGLPNPNNRSLTKPLDFQVDYVRTWAAPS